MHLPSPFNPSSPHALATAHLFTIVLWLMAAIFVLVTGLVLYIAWRYRRRPEQSEPRQVFGNTTLEIAWTVVPTLLLVLIFGLTVNTMSTVDPPVAQEQADLRVIGHQWWWEVRYLKSGAVTANEIHLPVGRQMLVQLEATDVIHDFWVPELARKIDMIPGHPNHLWLRADHAGIYLGACAEFCGMEHAWMRFRVIAQSPAEFEAWERDQLENASSPDLPEARQGARLFQEKTCVSCHAIAGTPATARIGPDLTHVASRQMLAAERVDNTPATLAQWLAGPQALKPGSLMPNLQLTPDEVQLLVAYLETLR